jgi:hypothetical protein
MQSIAAQSVAKRRRQVALANKNGRNVLFVTVHCTHLAFLSAAGHSLENLSCAQHALWKLEDAQRNKECRSCPSTAPQKAKRELAKVQC